MLTLSGSITKVGRCNAIRQRDEPPWKFTQKGWTPDRISRRNHTKSITKDSSFIAMPRPSDGRSWESTSIAPVSTSQALKRPALVGTKRRCRQFKLVAVGTSSLIRRSPKIKSRDKVGASSRSICGIIKLRSLLDAGQVAMQTRLRTFMPFRRREELNLPDTVQLVNR